MVVIWAWALVAALPRMACSEERALNCSAGGGRTFYADSEAGDDGNDGLAADRAWRSLERVNGAELAPGDTVRFRSGGLWRGELIPTSGQQDAPLTYTAYGHGPKLLLLGSLPRNRGEDWAQVGDNIWATLPVEYRLGDQLLDLRSSEWSRHQEAGARVEMWLTSAAGTSTPGRMAGR